MKENYNIGYIVTEHSSGFKKEIYNEKELEYASEVFKKSSYNLAVSRKFASFLSQKFALNFDFIENTVDTDSFTISKKRDSNFFNFLNIAFLNKNKNQKMLIKAFKKAFVNMPEVRLTIAGDGALYNDLRKLINLEEMQNQIFLYGRANRNEIRSLLHSSDVFVLSSEYETFGVVVIEALSCGLPVLSTKCGGPELILRDEGLGCLVDIDEDSISKGMIEIHKNTYDKKFIREFE